MNETDTRTPLFDKTFKDADGNMAIFQKPNASSVIFVTSTVLSFVMSGNAQNTAQFVASISGIVWAGQEVFNGTNYFRQLLGLGASLGLVGFMIYSLRS